MQRRPREPSERLFSIPMVAQSLVLGAVACAVVGMLYLFFAVQRPAAAELRTLTFFALIAAILALILATRSFSASFSQAVKTGNPALRYVFAIILPLPVVIMIVEPFRRLLQLAPLPIAHYAIAAATGAVLLLLFELLKALHPDTRRQRRG